MGIILQNMFCVDKQVNHIFDNLNPNCTVIVFYLILGDRS